MKARFIVAPRIPISWGELIDKITILEIKSENISAEKPLARVVQALTILQEIGEPVLCQGGELANLKSQLKKTNEKLWDIEDRIRDMEKLGDFGPDFINLARSVYKNNDVRAAIKKKINLRLVTGLDEEKCYKSGSET